MKNTVKINIEGMYINGRDAYLCPGFTNIFFDNFDNGIASRFICGSGIITEGFVGLASEAFLPDMRVAFCGFATPSFQKMAVVPVTCVTPIDDRISPLQAMMAGRLIPFIAAAERAKLSLGEHVLVICNEAFTGAAKIFFDYIGCIVNIINNPVQQNESFYEDVLSKITDRKKDAVIIMDENEIPDSVFTSVCDDTSRIVKVKGTGAGFDDADLMFAKIRYPYGYTHKTTCDNLRYAVSIVTSDMADELSMVCGKTLTDEVFFISDDGYKVSKIAKKDKEYVLSAKQKEDLLELRDECLQHIEPCMIQITILCPSIIDEIANEFLAAAEFILNTAVVNSDLFKTQNCIAVSASLADGSAIAIHVISGFLSKTVRYEVHTDGRTIIFENNCLKCF